MFGTLTYGLAALTAFVLQPANPAALSAGFTGQDAPYESRTSPGEVTLEVRPEWEAGVLSFAIAANTHSVDLSKTDLSHAVRLVIGDRSLRPDSAGRLRGHHARTDVRFLLTSVPERFVLEIRGVPDVPVRRLEWQRPRTDAAAESGGGPLVAVGGITPGGLAVLDAGSLRLIRTVGGLEAVHGSAVDAEGRRAFALDMMDAERAVTVIDIASGEVETTVALPGPGHHAAADPGGGSIYVAYGEMSLDGTSPRGIASVEPATGGVRTVPVDGTPFYLAADPDGRRLYATIQGPESGEGRLLSLDLPSLELYGMGKIEGTPSHLVVTPDGRTLYVALMEGRIVRLDAGRLEVVGDADAGRDAHAVELDCASGRVFVANRAAGTITVLDADSLEKLTELRVAKFPTHLLTLPDGRLLVSDGASRRLIVVDTGTLEVLARVELTFQPHQTSVSLR